jgi:large subunit ribosomal protein L4
MPTLTVKTQQGSESGPFELAAEVFGVELNPVVVREVYNAYRTNQRQGTHATRNRALIHGGGKKPWKQKGTGRARAGSSRSPLWRGGATIFGPMPKKYHEKVNRKKRRSAYRSLLSSKLTAGEIIIVDGVDFSSSPKTKEVIAFLDRVGAGRKSLIVTAERNDQLLRAAGNLRSSKARPTKVEVVDSVSIFDLLVCDSLVIEKAAITLLQERLS